MDVKGSPEREEVGFVDHAAPDSKDAVDGGGEQDWTGAEYNQD